MHHLAKLQAENQRLRDGTEQSILEEETVEAHGEVMHCFDNETYLDQPTWAWEESGPRLHALQRIPSVQVHLYQHPEVAFVVYRDYDETAENINERAKGAPNPYRESIALITADMRDAVREFVANVPRALSLFPDFNADAELVAPYPLFYHYFSLRDKVSLKLRQTAKALVQKLLDVVMENHGPLYRQAIELLARGLLTPKTVAFLIQPGDVVISTKEQCARGYIATTWAQRLADTDAQDLRRANVANNLDVLSAAFDSASDAWLHR